MALPASVVEKDHKLEEKAEHAVDEKMEYRWHWTLDESNPKRVSMNEYARSVGRARQAIQADANGWAAWLKSSGTGHDVVATTYTPGDHRELAKLGAERKEAVEAIAKATGKSITNVAAHKRKVVDAVVNRGRNKAEEKAAKGKPTTVADEIAKAAEWQAKAERLAESERKERKATHTAQFIKIEGKLGSMLAQGRQILEIAKDVDGFSEDEVEIMTDTIAKLSSLIKLMDLKITGQMPANYDWDTEFQKITNK